MREKKFKIFNSLTKKWIPTSLLDLQNIIDHIGWQNDNMILRDNDWAIFCVYMGLTDKNGKEIYEGDILQTPNGNKYSTNDFESLLDFGWWVHEYFDYPEKDLEIIGNIYENPELMNLTE